MVSGYKVFQAEPMDLIIDEDKYEDNSLNLKTDFTDVEGDSAYTPPEHSRIHLRNGVCLYEHTNFKGYVTYIYEEGVYSIADFKEIGIKNDDISSVRVAPGWSVELFEHHKQQGESKVFLTDEANLHNVKWNDRTSSFVVRHIGVAPQAVTPTDYSKTYQKYKNGIVSLLCKKSDGFYIGSGFIISHDGYMVTAAHNIVSDGQISELIIATVSSINGSAHTKRIQCSVVGVDLDGDIAVLKADLYNQTFFHWGKSRYTSIGTQMCTFGDPKGQDFQSFSAGHVRDNMYSYRGGVESVAVDAQIYEGCSGSPLLDIHGQVIGIVCFGIRGGDGFSWGASQHMLEPIVNTIIQSGRDFEKGNVDFKFKPVDAYFLLKISAPLSYNIEGVYATENSRTCDIKANDIIIKVNDIGLQVQSLVSALWFMKHGEKVVLTYLRPPETTVRVTECTVIKGENHNIQQTLSSQYLISPIKVEL